MAPSPAAGRTAEPPETPTKVGKNPESSATTKLSDSAKTTPKSKPPKLGAAKATAKGSADSPKLPPRPKDSETESKDVEEKAESSADDVESETDQKISMKDTGLSEDVEETPGKVSQPGNETGAENTSAADTSELSEANPEPIEEEEEAEATVTDVKGSAKDTAKEEGSETEGAEESGIDDAAEEAEDEAESSTGALGGVTEGATKGAKDLADTTAGGKEAVANGTEKLSAGDDKDKAETGAEAAKDTTEDTVQDVKTTANGVTKETPEDDEAVPDAGKAVNGVKAEAEEEAAGGTEDAVSEPADGGKATASGALGDASDQLPTDLSALKGLKVRKGGEILNREGRAIGQVEEGDPEDLIGYKVADNGEILDEDGDLIGRVKLLRAEAKESVDKTQEAAEDVPEVGEEAADGVETYLPDIKILKGLEVQENGDIRDAEGKLLGKITAGDPADLVGMQLNAEGEILDEDGDVVGRAEVLPQEVPEAPEEAAHEEAAPQPGALEGLEVSKGGDIKDAEGKVVGKVTEGDPADLVGKQVNVDGEILDSEGDVIGRTEALPQEATEAIPQEATEAVPPEATEAIPPEATGAVEEAQPAVEELEEKLQPTVTILEGRKLNKKGKIIDDEGEVLAQLVEGDPKQCAGKVPNENGEILDKDGNVIGKVEIVPGEAADEAMRELHPEVVQQLEEAQAAAEGAGEAADQAGEAAAAAGEAADEAKGAAEGVGLPEFSILEGLKVNKKGLVVNEDGDPIARLAQGNLEDVKGKKLNEKGEILDKDGKVLGKVEFIPQAIEEGLVEVPEATPDLGTSILEGLKVNRKGQVLNEDGEVIAELSEGELEKVAGKKLNDKGEVLDKDGNVIGKVNLVEQAKEEAEESKEEVEDVETGLPALSILEGLKVNKMGKLIDKDGNIVGELVQGDAKKIWKSGVACDDQGQFWDNKGHIIGKAQTLPQETDEAEAEFAGLEGLIVVKDGWVEDENGNRVGKISEGDPKKLVGRSVDEDGDIVDKRGNVVGHAERYDEPEVEAEPEPEPEKVDLSELKGLTCNKQGNVIGQDGVPVARLVEGNPKELAGRKIDENGQIWNEAGKVVGRCELIPISEREAKPEGPFAGLDGLLVVKDGLVEDAEHNVVGKVVEGDPKKLIGRAVDEDGDIIDKYGNVKGHVEPYEIPEEEVVEEDLSSLAGKTVNKQGKVVDEHGTIFGEIAEGDPKQLVGHKVDGKGQIWSDDGKVIGQARLIPGGGEGRAEGPFSNFESTIVSKDGLVKDAEGQIVGRVIEGDPKKLVGRKVDDDGDILDKNGNPIGKAERWDPDEELVEEDLSSLAGKKVNKQGKVVDEHGTIFGEIAEGDPKKLAGRKVDGKGQIWSDDGKVIGQARLIPGGDEGRAEGPFSNFESTIVSKDGLVKDAEGQIVGRVIEGDPKKLVGRKVDDDGDILDKNGNPIGKAERWDPDEELVEEDLSSLAGKRVNKQGKVVDEHGTIFGEIAEGDPKALAGHKVDGKGQIWSDDGKVIGQARLIAGGDASRDGPFSNFESTIVSKDGLVKDAEGQIVGRVIEGDPKKLVGRKVDDDGDILDKNGNAIGKAERWEPEEKEREISPMSGLRINKAGEVRDKNGDVIGRLTEGNLLNCIGKEVDDNGHVVDQDGNKLGEVTLLENIPDPEEPEEEVQPELTEQEMKDQEEREVAKKIGSILKQTLEKMEPICKQITEHIEKADRTPKEELDEEQLVQNVKPLIEEGSRILGECNGAIRGLDPDGHIAANAKAKHASGEATPEEHMVAEGLKELTSVVVKTVDNAKKRIADMPHAKKKLNPLWGLLTEPLVQIIAAVGLLLSGVLGLVGKLLNALGLGGLVNGILGGLGIGKLLKGLGLGSITEALGLGGGDKKKK